MKPLALLLLLAVAGSVMAEPANNFSNIVQNFAHSHGLKYVQTATDTQNGWSYNFYPQGNVPVQLAVAYWLITAMSNRRIVSIEQACLAICRLLLKAV